MKLHSDHQRVITGLTLLAVLIIAISMGGPLLVALLLAAAALGVWEFLSLYWPGRHRARKLFTLGLGSALILAAALDHLAGAGALLPATVFALALPLIGLLFLFDYGRGNTGARLGDYAPMALAFYYVPAALALTLFLSPAEQCLAVVAAVATDTGGYYAGTRFGRHKIWPLVSPKKSWEGLAGGLALCMPATAAFGAAAAHYQWPAPILPVWAWIIIGFALNQAALFGDFFESALKRSLDVKDSGALLPGHGGVLDRIDSLLFVLPAYTALRLIALALIG